MKRILLTGATGLIGRQLLALVSGAGYEVHAVMNRREVPAELESVAVTWHEMDLLRKEASARIMREVKPGGLMHLAWSTTPGTSGNDINREWLRASRELIRIFYENGGERALIAGSCLEYHRTQGICSEERTPRKPNTVYGSCKNDLRQFTEDLCRRENLSWAWGRIFFVYGPHEHPKRFVSSVILSLLGNQVARCTHGLQIRDYLHSRDVASGLVRLFESGLVGECNVASGQPVTLRKIAEAIAARVGGHHLLEFGARPAPPGEAPVIVADVSRLNKELQWQPRITLNQGIEETIDAWRRELHASAGPLN